MTKLEELQKENRKFIIMANNPTAKTYEEALEIDQKPIRDALSRNLVGAYWCDRVWEGWQVGTMTEDDFSEIGCEDGDDGFEDLVNDLYKPLTLNRVLIALSGLACNLCLLDVDENYNIFIKLDDPFSDVGSFYWDLTKETLEEQSEETQKEINRIINSN